MARPPPRVPLEVKVGMDAVRVPRVPDEADRLPGEDTSPALQAARKRDAVHTASPVVVAVRQVVVQMDVQVRRPAPPVEVEHAAGARRPLVEPDLAGLGGECERAPWSEDVDSLVGSLGPRGPEVVRVVGRAEHREDDALPRGRRRLRLRLRRRRRFRRCGSRPYGNAEKGQHEKCSGCRPVSDHGAGPRSKCGRLTDVPASLRLRSAR